MDVSKYIINNIIVISVRNSRDELSRFIDYATINETIMPNQTFSVTYRNL